MSYAKHVYRCSWTFTEVLDNIHEINGLTDFSLLDYHPQRYGGFVSILSYSLDGHNMIERLNLTEAELRKLVPRAAPYQKWDEKVRNLCVRVQPSGRRTFYFVYSVGGKTKWHRFGPADAVDIVAARRETQRLIGLVLDGQIVSAERGDETFGELHRRYLKYAEKKNKSWRQAERLIINHVLPKWANREAKMISRRDVQVLFDGIATPVLANQVLAAVSAVFQFAVRRNDSSRSNPARGIERHDVGEGRDRVLSDDELRRFKIAGEAIDPVRRAALLVILLTGQRPGEVARMRREHIRDGWWTLPGNVMPELGWRGTKNKRPHRVYLVAEVRRLIGSPSEQTGFVFANRNAKAITSLDAAMRRISEALDPPRATPHDLRRTFASRVGECSHRVEDIERILNHRTGTRESRIYNRYNYERQTQQVMEDVAALILRLMDGEDNVVIQFKR